MHHPFYLLLFALPIFGFNWAGFGSAVSNIGSAVTQSLAQAGVFGGSAQRTALTQPLAPPAAAAGAPAYTAATFSTPITVLMIGIMVVVVLVALIRR